MKAGPLRHILNAPFRPTLELTANVTVDVGNLNSSSFNGVNTGRANALRRTILAVLLRTGTVSSGMTVTQDGVAMTSLLELISSNGGTTFLNFFGLDNHAGESSDFVVSMAGSVRCKVLVYSLIAKSMTPLATFAVTSTSAGLASLTASPTSGIIIPSGRPVLCTRYTQQASGTVNQYGTGWRGVTGLTALSESFSMNSTATATNTTFTPTGFVGDEEFDQILESASSTGAEAMAGLIW